jgi:hypothetical protein
MFPSKGMFAQYGESLGSEPEVEDSGPSAPLSPEEYVDGSSLASALSPNPVLDDGSETQPDAGIKPPEDLLSLAELQGSTSTSDLSPGPLSQATNDPQVKADMRSMLQQKAQARAERSEAFQARAKEMNSGNSLKKPLYSA